MEIKYFNQQNSKIEIEKVYGNAAINWLYGTPMGKSLSPCFCRAPLSVLYGQLQSLGFSKHKVEPFIENFNINMDEYLPSEGRNSTDPYGSFNEFFIRRFKEGKRPFSEDQNRMGAFAEARYFAYDSIRDDEVIPVKGKFLNAPALLGKEKWGAHFKDGPLLLARLCPVDYHRFHFPDDGKVVDHYKVNGLYHSVNPLALKKMADIFSTNIREVTILKTKNFGDLAYVEVGAMMVGKIIQSTDLSEFKKGDEKGYFLFGGSTVIVIGEKRKWRPLEDMVKRTKEGIETYVQLGMPIASSSKE